MCLRAGGGGGRDREPVVRWGYGTVRRERVNV